MPHLFISRPRLFDPGPSSKNHAALVGETTNAFLYKLGGLIFVFGSILFLPSMHAYMDIGSWSFFVGSLVYLVVTVSDLLEVRLHGKSVAAEYRIGHLLELVAANCYVVGTLLFTVGSILFLSFVDMQHAGAWCFVSGSSLFVVGACINVLQIFRFSSRLTIQLTNLTAISFVVGSVLFTVASIPYLWELQAPDDQTLLYRFLAWQYLSGSTLFFLGGVFNYWKTLLVRRNRKPLP